MRLIKIKCWKVKIFRKINSLKKLSLFSSKIKKLKIINYFTKKKKINGKKKKKKLKKMKTSNLYKLENIWKFLKI